MPPLYHDHELLLKGKITRREFFKRAVAAGVVTPTILSFLQGCAPQAAPAPATEAPPAGPVKYSKPEGITKETTQARPLIFQTYEFESAMVQDFCDTFMEQYDEAAEYSVVPGDYTAVMLNKLLSKAPLDLLYTQDQGPKFYKAGWLQDLSGLWSIDEIKEACLPPMWDAMTVGDAVIGLPYFNAVKGMVMTNEVLREKAGLKGQPYPKDYDELYAECKELKKQGVTDAPFLPFWAPVHYGITQYFCAECFARGDMLWDDEYNPTFGPDTAVAQVLEGWKMLYADKIAPQGALTWADADRMDALNSGQHVYGYILSYDLKSLNDPASSTIAGSVQFIPYAGQSWGVLDYGLYSLAAKPADDKQLIERLLRFVEFMGYKDKEGNYLTAKMWAIKWNLGVGYPEVYDDPEVNAAYQEWMPEFPKMKDDTTELFKHVNVNRGWKAIWFPDWNAFCQQELPLAITGDKPVAEVIEAVKQAWLTSKELYKK
jgi:multiple sugar transport system substrate-binding protein